MNFLTILANVPEINYHFIYDTQYHISKMPQEKETLKIYRVSQTRQARGSLVSSRFNGGFTDEEDSRDGRINLNRELIRHPLSTVLVRAGGDSMKNAGITRNCLLVVDRSATPQNGNIIIARIGGELSVRRLSIGYDGSVRLLSENGNYKPIEVTEEMDFEIWGRVIYSIREH